LEQNKYKEAIEVLGLPLEFSLTELKKVYREKIKENHPDIANINKNTDKIQAIKESYDLLNQYIQNYKISFRSKDIKLSPDEFLKRKIMQEWKV